MNGTIVDAPDLGRGAEVPINETSDLSGTIGEAVGDCGEGEGEEVFDEEGYLRCFAAAVDSFEEDEGSSFTGSGSCLLGRDAGVATGGAVDDHYCNCSCLSDQAKENVCTNRARGFVLIASCQFLMLLSMFLGLSSMELLFLRKNKLFFWRA